MGEGDEGAFRALYRRHNPKVYRFVLRMVGGDTAEAEDIMQETWLRAARALERFRWQSALSSWLSGIALNRVRGKPFPVPEVEEAGRLLLSEDQS